MITGSLLLVDCCYRNQPETDNMLGLDKIMDNQ